MKNEEFLKDVCPNHTEKSKWNRSELLHILKMHEKQLLIQRVSKSFNSEEELLQHLYYIMPFAVKPKIKKKFEFVGVFKSKHAFEYVCKHLANKLFNVC